MQPKWLIEDFEADNKFDLLAEEVKRQGMEVEIIKYIPFESGSYNTYKNYDCVIVQTSINLAKQLQREKDWIPGPWMNTEAYECFSFYPHLGQYLLNNDYVMLPRSEVKRKWEDLLKIFDTGDDAVFIRPSTGQKSFTGKVFQTKYFEKDWEWVEQYTKPEDVVIIASVKTILKEWRFVVADYKILTGSLYKQRIGGVVSSGKYREINLEDEDDHEAYVLARHIAAQKYKCDPMYVIDICKDESDMCHLLEIGSFSCAGLYDCNLEKIVKTAKKIAIRQWNSVHKSTGIGLVQGSWNQ